MPDHPDEAASAVAEVFRDQAGRVLASLIPLCGGDFDAAEEALHDAFVIALERWPRTEIPARPAAWVLEVARHKAVDRLRREGRRPMVESEALRLERQRRPEPRRAHGIGDDRLRLLFTCCHPALSLEARVALTLRTIGGLSTAEIARAFLVPEPTMAQRLVRAKHKIRAARIPYRVPPASQLPERLDGLLAVLYLIFNEGYSASAGDRLLRPDLCAEAIREARIVVELMDGEPEAAGLLALLLLQDSRRDARCDPQGFPIPLEEQDRSVWDRAAIAEGLDRLSAALWRRRPGPYQVQAAIAALHAEAPAAAATDWPQIALLYTDLMRRAPSPVVALNRAVAVAMARGPQAGLELIDTIAASGALDGYHPLWAARADLLRRAGRDGEAAVAYRQALAIVGNGAERAFLERRLALVEAAAERPASDV